MGIGEPFDKSGVSFTGKSHKQLPALSIRVTDQIIKNAVQEVVVLDKHGNPVGLLTGVRQARYVADPHSVGKVILELDGYGVINSVEAR